jgi:ubiquitin-protein ligase
VKDLQLLEKNRDELNSRGIFWHFDPDNIMQGAFLIIPKHKQDLNDPTLVSPYTGGMFIFKMNIPSDYPLSPPEVKFYPQQQVCRLHPNYYQNGKVCLSSLNSWGSPDWCPSMSLMSLANTFEERLNERSLWHEPGREQESNGNLKEFNKIVAYGVAQVAICDVLEHKRPEYAPFYEIIEKHWDAAAYMELAKKNAAIWQRPYKARQACYSHEVTIDWSLIVGRLERLNEKKTLCEQLSGVKI